MLNEISQKVKQGEGINDDQIRWILEQDEPEVITKIGTLANQMRSKTIGPQVCIHGIIEFSNYCRNNCLYCGIRSSNKAIHRYRLTPDQIVNLAEMAVTKLGYKMLVLQSGEDIDYTTDKLVYIIKKISEKCHPLLFLSIGERDITTYEKLYLAGARGVLFRFETSSKEIFEKMHPQANYEERLNHLRFMRDIGYIIATGPLIGLPGQTTDTLMQDFKMIRELGAKMISTGPLVPHHQTPLSGEGHITEEQMLRTISAMRLAFPHIRIPITTAMEYLWGDSFRKKALTSGANAFMLNLTPPEVKDLYDIYPEKNKIAHHLHSVKSMTELNSIIQSCQMNICTTFGKEFELTDSAFVGGCQMISD